MKDIGTQNVNGLDMPKGYETPFHMPKSNLAFYKKMKQWQKGNGFSKTNYKEPYTGWGTQETTIKTGWDKN